MLGLIKNECWQVLHKKKLYLSLGFLLANLLINIFQIKVYVDQEVLAMNGQSFPLQILSGSSFFIAIIITVLLADMVCEEYRQGTFKTALAHPIHRYQLVTAKLVGMVFIIAILIGFTVLISYIIGNLVFPWGDHILVQGNPLIVKGQRLQGFHGVSTTLLAGLGFFLSVFGFSMIIFFFAFAFEKTTVTIGIGVALVLLTNLATDIKILKEYFVGSFMNILPSMIMTDLGLRVIMPKIVISILYVLVFYSLSMIYFSKKDVI
ncbi:MAG: ABC transporter permease subunit [Miniphocaeibacter sp.]|uniref:ABC transporter permease subunit n=1 Tax=Miniphocaeibacter sp. TaxID=3100973 RepID=UPI0017B3FE5D|nr:ABC transporter permease subunit [Gallicola sp.]